MRPFQFVESVSNDTCGLPIESYPNKYSFTQILKSSSNTHTGKNVPDQGSMIDKYTMYIRIDPFTTDKKISILPETGVLIRLRLYPSNLIRVIPAQGEY